MKTKVKQLNKRVCEVRAGYIGGIAVTEDGGKTWELSPALRANAESVLKRVHEVYLG